MSGKMVIRMVLDDLKELFRVRKAISIAEYKEAMKAHHRIEDSMFLLREQGRSLGVLSHEHYQALRMVMGDLKELFIAKELRRSSRLSNIGRSLLQPMIGRLLRRRRILSQLVELHVVFIPVSRSVSRSCRRRRWFLK